MERTKTLPCFACLCQADGSTDEIDNANSRPNLVSFVGQPLTLALACRDHDSGNDVRLLVGEPSQPERDLVAGQVSHEEAVT